MVACICAAGVVVGISLYASAGRLTLVASLWCVELVLVGAVAAYARKLFGKAEEQRSRAVDRVSRLSEANVLLTSLHDLAQTLPASLDLAEVLEVTLPRLREVIEFDAGAVLLRDHATGLWSVAAADGMRLGRTLTEAQLPAPLGVAVSGTRAWLEPHLSHEEGAGLDAFSRSGVYAPLRARDTLLGLIALEHHEPDHFDRADRDLLGGFAEPAALAIDNARWFSRLRTVGAHEERSRIARDLHDRVGQSLAYLAFQLDRLVSLSQKGAPVDGELTVLREDVRSVIGEVRETLFDLRTDVTPDRGIGDTLASFLQRVRKRTAVEVSFTRKETARIALPREREIWRIAQEAITNAERHAQAGHLDVSWECTPFQAVLTVSDDGRGFGEGDATRSDAYGLVGMRERADAIGARLDVTSSSNGGTVVQCRVGAP